MYTIGNMGGGYKYTRLDGKVEGVGPMTLLYKGYNS